MGTYLYICVHAHESRHWVGLWALANGLSVLQLSLLLNMDSNSTYHISFCEA